MIGVVLCVKNGEERWGKGKVLGHGRKGWGVGFTSSGWLLLGVKSNISKILEISKI